MKDGSVPGASSTNNHRHFQELIEKSKDEISLRSFVSRGEVLLLLEGGTLVAHAHKLEEFAIISETLSTMTDNDDRPPAISLPENVVEFSKALELLYTPIYNIATPSVDVLLSSLSMATKYGHPSLLAFVAKELGSRQHELPAIERIAIGRACNVSEWVSDAIDELSQREQPLTLEEAIKLGAETFANISSRRECRKYKQGYIEGWKDLGQAVSSGSMVRSCSDIRIEGSALHAMTICSSMAWDGEEKCISRKPAYFDLDQVMANFDGRFGWKPQGYFSHSARHVVLNGTRMTAELRTIGGGWREDHIELNGWFYGLDGIMFVRNAPVGG